MYEDAVREAFDGGLGEGSVRRAGVLALITRLKQICNHPAQALGEDGPLDERSGKFDRLVEMVGESVDNGVHCLCSPSSQRWAGSSPTIWSGNGA